MDGPRAWARPEELATALGWEPADVDRIATGLEAAGLVDRWNENVTLSPLGASRLGIHLVANERLELYRWSSDSASARSRRPSHRAIRRMHDHDWSVQQIADPGALEAQDIALRAEKRVRRRAVRDDCPFPVIILWGNGLLVWDELNRQDRPELRCRSCRPRLRRHKQIMAALCGCGLGHRPRPNLQFCPGCHGRPLRPSMYCLRCDRWGLDGYFARKRIRRPIYLPRRARAG
jgi:hypothetical protein